MQVRDIDRLIVTQEPVTIGREVYRIQRLSITFKAGVVEYTADVLDAKGKLYRTQLSDLRYLDGRSSI